MPRSKRTAPIEEPNVAHNTPKRRQTKSDIEKLICKKKLDSLETEETLSKDDRFSFAEKERLLEAFNVEGYKVLQDVNLLHKYFPLRRKNDLKGLLTRLTLSLQVTVDSNLSEPLEDWSKVCQKMLGAFAKDKKVSADSALSDALLAEAMVLEQEGQPVEDDYDASYPELLKSFSQLMMGKFPDNLSPTNSLLLVNLFEHVNKVADSYLAKVSGVKDCSWLTYSTEKRTAQQELAVKGLETFDFTTKKCPTFRDLENSEELKALCLELPKIKRITDVLNPLGFTETVFSDLME